MVAKKFFIKLMCKKKKKIKINFLLKILILFKSHKIEVKKFNNSNSYHNSVKELKN